MTFIKAEEIRMILVEGQCVMLYVLVKLMTGMLEDVTDED